MIERATPGVGAGAGHQRNTDTDAVPGRGGKGRRLHPHFLNHVCVRRGRHASANAVVGRAVDAVFSTAHAAERRDGLRGTLHESLHRKANSGIGAQARRVACQHDRHVRHRRQLFELLRREIQPRADAGRFEQRRFTGDGHRFLNGTNLERKIERNLPGAAERNPGAIKGPKAGHFNRDTITPGDKQLCLEVSATVGGDLLRDVRAGVDDFDRRARDDSLGVSDCPRDRAACLLRQCWPDQQE